MSNTPHILVIEDDQDIRELIKLQLELKNYHVSEAQNGMEALSLINENNYDLFLIDRMLPDSNGIAICEKLRASEKNQSTPIILITALSEPEDIIKGLDSGADDYITKPFDINILHARVRAQLRRNISVPENKEQIELDGLFIDLPKCKVKVNGQEINLNTY
jgi:DNA-binding response OmpR family regulator